MLHINSVCYQIADVSKGSPLVLSGGQALVTPLYQLGEVKYKGWVQHVDPEHVYLHFSEE